MEPNKNKTTSTNIPTKTLKTIARDIYVPLTDCINSDILNSVFPDELKLADVKPLYKKSDKTNHQPISILPPLSKVHEKMLCKQLNPFFETKLSSHLCGSCSRYSTQLALSNFSFNWQNCLEKSGVVGTILMDLFKPFACLPHNLIITKLHAYSLDHDSLRLIRNYLSN